MTTPPPPIATPCYQALLDEFLSGKSPSTQRAYLQDLRDFQQYQGTESLSEALEDFFSSPHSQANLKAMHYRHLMEQRGLKQSSINRRISMLRALSKTALRKGLAPWALQIDPLESEKNAPTVTDPARIKKVFAWFKDQADRPLLRRDLAIVLLIRDLAFTNSELSSLRLQQLDLFLGLLHRPGTPPLKLNQRLRQALKAWVEVRCVDPGPLFDNFDHAGKAQGLSGTSIYRIIRALGEASGIKMTPRSLRQGVIRKKVQQKKEGPKGLQELLRFSGHRHVKSLKGLGPPIEDLK